MDNTITDLFGRAAGSQEAEEYWYDTVGSDREDGKYINIYGIKNEVSQDGLSNLEMAKELKNTLSECAKVLAGNGIKNVVINMGKMESFMLGAYGLNEHGVVIESEDGTPTGFNSKDMIYGEKLISIYRFFAKPFEGAGLKTYAGRFEKDMLEPLVIGNIVAEGEIALIKAIDGLALPPEETAVVMDNHAAYYVKTSEPTRWFSREDDFKNAGKEVPVQFKRSVVYQGNNYASLGGTDSLLPEPVANEISRMVGNLEKE
jgi:hypothetical protein